MPQTGVEIEVEGLKELQKKAIQMVSDMHGQVMVHAMRDVLITLVRRVVANPPGGYGPSGSTSDIRNKVGYIPVDTGRLRASVTPKFQPFSGSPPTVAGVVGTNVHYGPYQEFGTKRVRALKFFKTSLKDNAKYIKDRFADAIQLVVKKRPR